jgi:tetratricopeptide (TPR) repeat protein
MTEIPLKEKIKNISLSKLLAYLNRNRKTGTLLIKTITFAKKIFLLKGDAVFASSTYEDDRLGEMLIKAGKINMEQYDESVKLLKKTGKRQGAILVELGYLTPKDLFWGVKFQVREIIYSLFLLEDAEYEFIEGEIPADEVITLKMSMGNLIYEGIKRIDNWTRIRNEMPSADTVLKLSADPITLFQDVELTPQDRKLLSIIDGTKTIKELIDSAWIGSFEGMKILFVLWSIGVLEEKKLISEKAQEMESVSLEEILQPVTEDEYAYMKKVDDLYLNLNSINPYELLEADSTSDEDTLKKNYYRLTREFHPDRYFSSADPQLKDKLTAIFDALTNAYTILKNSLKSKVKNSILHKEQKEEPRTLSADEEFKRGVEAFKKSNFQGAVEAFRLATGLAPKNARYWSYLSLSLTKIPESLIDAEQAILEAVRLEPHNADNLANLGLIYTMQGIKTMALEQFRKALKIDPGNIKARKGLDKIKT